jgi:hypothetical protein
MSLKDRLDDVARRELHAERARYLAAVTESDGDPRAFVREFETHVFQMSEIMQSLVRRLASAGEFMSDDERNPGRPGRRDRRATGAGQR